MNLFNHYWYFSKALSSKFCDDLIKHGEDCKDREVMGITGHFGMKRDPLINPLNKKELKNLKKVRDSNIIFMNDRWIYKEIHPFIHMANKNARWNFDWDYSEGCQLTKYSKGQFYDWHQDAWEHPYPQEGPTKGKVRKLSVTINLTDPKEYKGGELEFDFKNLSPSKKQKLSTCPKEALAKGSIIVFPSFVWHRVKPVTKGTRHSLVIWNVGYPFK